MLLSNSTTSFQIQEVVETEAEEKTILYTVEEMEENFVKYQTTCVARWRSDAKRRRVRFLIRFDTYASCLWL